MFDRKTRSRRRPSAGSFQLIEILEGRRMLSASAHPGHGIAFGSVGHNATIEFSQAPTAVQTGLDSLATTDGLTAPSSTQAVYLKNVNGLEEYSVRISGTGTQSILTVDQNGTAITAPTTSTTTFSALGTSDSAAASEISAIATALSLTAPTSSTVVHMTTASTGLVTYSVKLGGSSSSKGSHATTISVDASGNPVGNQTLPFDVLPTAIQDGLNSNAPSGATALSSTSTQNVKVQTLNGVTTYSTTFTVSATTTTVTVNSAGVLTNLPSTTSTTFSAIPTAAQTELQTLATADGYSGTISSSATISAYDEANGTTIYTITLPVTQTGSDGSSTYTVNLTLSVDEAGNPTVLPNNGPGGGGAGGNCGATGGSSSASSGTTSRTSAAGSFIYGLAIHRG